MRDLPEVKYSAGFVSRAAWTTLGILWLAVVVTGLTVLARYDRTPGVAAQPQARWPAGSQLARDEERPTLVMLAHPRCTCTRASVAELAELMARVRQRPRAYIVFIKPESMPDGWEQSDLWAAAHAIADVTVVRDERGLEAQLFGAETSGQTFLYDADGRLLFSGGTTGARGHQGDNPGRAALVALINREGAAGSSTPVFGCSLFAPNDRDDATEVVSVSSRD